MIGERHMAFTCDDCGTEYKYAVAVAMCCSPLNDETDLDN